MSLAGGNHGNPDSNPFARASVALLEREIAIIVQAAHRVASFHAMPWPDYERVHDAHQHVVAILAIMRGKEVWR